MIFNLFKSKPKLKDLIPQEYVDIHSHILPGIDDGAKDIDDSKLLILEMKKLGFKKAIATPHTYPGIYENTNQSIIKSFEKVKNESSINIDYASEYLIGNYLLDSSKNRNLLTIGENYVLVEMNFVSEPKKLYEIIFEIQTNGYNIILAHPERYNFLFSDLKKVFKLKDRGLKFQLNLLSICGFYGKTVLNNSEKLIKNKLFDFTGSDAHNLYHLKYFNNKSLVKNPEKITELMDANKIFI